MVTIRQRILIFTVLWTVLLPALLHGQKFYPDDPIRALPDPLPVGKMDDRNLDDVADFFLESAHWTPPPPTPAAEVNTLGEVPDSAWFTNRHAYRRLTRDELQRGAGNRNEPVPPFTVIGGKAEGISPGFRMQDSAGRTYFVKSDPLSYPELATAADVIVSKFLWAIGYNTPENYIIYPHREDFRLADDATTKAPNGGDRKMTRSDFEAILAKILQYEGGAFRLMASLSVAGKPIGPFRYHGTRSDDPNDIVPHESRRNLRGLSVIAAWLNHTDAKANNSLDTVVEDKGLRYVRHYLLDFGSALGSDSDRPKDARFGHRFMLPTPMEALDKTLALGLYSPKWERADFPKIRGVGHFDAEAFEAEHWKSDYPNPAFLSRLADDEYWGAKQVMAFTDDDIRAIVETGRFTDPRAVDYLTMTLAARRDKIGRAFFLKLVPLDNFRVENAELRFDDLAAKYGFRPAEQYTVRWSRFNNVTGGQELLVETSAKLPVEAAEAPAGTYFAASIKSPTVPSQALTVYVRAERDVFKVVGIERGW
jgi:hypothetical protein